MSQQYPQQPQQPNWGQQPTQPGYGYPQPQPPKKRSTGKILGIIAGVFVGLIVIGAIAGGGESSSGDKASTVTATSPAAEDPEQKTPEAEEAAAEPEPAPEAPVKITAKKAPFAKSILAQDGNYTSVKVTVTNNSDETISVNPLYFSITDTDGTKHSAELAADENQIDTVKLAPGENVSGSITGKGKFTAKTVTYTDGFFSDPIRVDVS
jgi:hypothetical protein